MFVSRVKAINDEGESEPLEGDKPFKAKNPFGKFPLVPLVYLDHALLEIFLKISKLFLSSQCSFFRVQTILQLLLCTLLHLKTLCTSLFSKSVTLINVVINV